MSQAIQHLSSSELTLSEVDHETTSLLTSELSLPPRGGLLFAGWSQRLVSTCFDITENWISVGTNTGALLLFDRLLDKLQHRLRPRSVVEEVATVVKMKSTVDHVVALSTSSGGVYIFQIPSPQLTVSTKQQVLRSYTVCDLHRSQVTCLEWSSNAMKLFSADFNGLIVCTEIDYILSESRSYIVTRECDPVNQLSYTMKTLLVSTRRRTILCSSLSSLNSGTSDSLVIQQVGQQDRKTLGDYGAVFAGGTLRRDDVELYAARPGLRMWKAHVDGDVTLTLVCKDHVLSRSSGIQLRTELCSTATLTSPEFGRVLIYSENLLLTYSQHALFIIDTRRGRPICYHTNLGHILDVTIDRTDIYVLRRGSSPAEQFLRLAALSSPPQPPILSPPLSSIRADCSKPPPSLTGIILPSSLTARVMNTLTHLGGTMVSVSDGLPVSGTMVSVSDGLPVRGTMVSVSDGLPVSGTMVSKSDGLPVSESMVKVLDGLPVSVSDGLPVSGTIALHSKVLSVADSSLMQVTNKTECVLSNVMDSIVPDCVRVDIINNRTNSKQSDSIFGMHKSHVAAVDISMVVSDVDHLLAEERECDIKDNSERHSTWPQFSLYHKSSSAAMAGAEGEKLVNINLCDVAVEKGSKPDDCNNDDIVFVSTGKRPVKVKSHGDGCTNLSTIAIVRNIWDAGSNMNISTGQTISASSQTDNSHSSDTSGDPPPLNTLLPRSRRHSSAELSVVELRERSSERASNSSIDSTVAPHTVRTYHSDDQVSVVGLYSMEVWPRGDRLKARACHQSFNIKKSSDNCPAVNQTSAQPITSLREKRCRQNDLYKDQQSHSHQSVNKEQLLKEEQQQRHDCRYLETRQNYKEQTEQEQDCIEQQENKEENKEMFDTADSNTESSLIPRTSSHDGCLSLQSCSHPTFTSPCEPFQSIYTSFSSEARSRENEEDEEWTELSSLRQPPRGLVNTSTSSLAQHHVISTSKTTPSPFSSSCSQDEPHNLDDKGSARDDWKDLVGECDSMLGVDEWTELPPPYISLTSLSLSRHHVWCTDTNGDIQYATHINDKYCPILRWVHLERSPCVPACQIAVSPSGDIVWCLQRDNCVYAANMVMTSRLPAVGVSNWREVAREVRCITVDDHTAWYVKLSGAIMMQKSLSRDRTSYRSLPVMSDDRISQVITANGVTWVATDRGRLLARGGVTNDIQEGTHWLKVTDQRNFSNTAGQDTSLFGASLCLAPNGYAWIVGAHGCVWYTTEVTSLTPNGSGLWYQISIGEQVCRVSQSHAVLRPHLESSVADELPAHARLSSTVGCSSWLGGVVGMLRSSSGSVTRGEEKGQCLWAVGGLVGVAIDGTVWIYLSGDKKIRVSHSIITGYCAVPATPAVMGMSLKWKNISSVVTLSPKKEGVLWLQLPNGSLFVIITIPHSSFSSLLSQHSQSLLPTTVLQDVCARIVEVSSPVDGSSFVCMSASVSSLWALSSSGVVYVRTGVTAFCPQGVDWVQEDLYTLGTSSVQLVALSVGTVNVWSVDSNGQVYLRIGSSPPSDHKLNPGWIEVIDTVPVTSIQTAPSTGDVLSCVITGGSSGALGWSSVALGKSSGALGGQSNRIMFTRISASPDDQRIWTADNRGYLYIRQGVTESLPLGTHWTHITDLSNVDKICVSNSHVYVLTTHNECFIRHGITDKNISGDFWTRIPGFYNDLTGLASATVDDW